MLIRDDGESWTAIGQPAHAWLAGQLARAWAPTPAPSVLLAIEQHDVAWTALDRRPPLNRDAGRACSFSEVAMEQRVELWSRVVDRLVMADPYAAVLVSLHATNIHTRYGRTTPEPFLAAQRADQDALLERIPGAGREQAERDAELLFHVDALSLAICGMRSRTELPLIDGVARIVTVAGAHVCVDPWPFEPDELRVGIHERVLGTRHEGEPELHDALDHADWSWREWLVRPREQFGDRRARRWLRRRPVRTSGGGRGRPCP